MSQKSFPSFFSYLQDSKKYIWIFLFSQLFPICFYIFNNGKIQHFRSPSISGELLKLSLTTITYLIIFIAIGYIVNFFLKKEYKKVFIFLIILNFIGNGIEFFIYLNFGTSITHEMVPILLETNRNEAEEFLQFYVNGKLFFLLAYFLIGILMSLKINKQVFLTGLIFSVLIIFIGVNFYNIPRTDYAYKTHMYPRVISSYIGYKKNAKETKRLMANLDMRYKDINVSDTTSRATYILIIGESFSRNHSQLFGYPRETSPCLLKRYNEGELLKFNDVVSPHNYTRDAVLKIITEYAHDSKKRFGESVNIIDLFKKAGYKTFWLSNQGYFDDKGAGLSSIINRADISQFTSKKEEDSGKLDSALFPFLDEALADKADKKFIVIHLYGSHTAYDKRYPDNFKFFGDSSEEKYFTDGQRNEKKIVNQYHNALRYNDYVINQIIQNVDDHSQNSFIIYLSDHGEVIYEDNVSNAFHVSPYLSQKVVEIPMVVWTSEYYREHNKEKIARIKAAEDKPFASEDVIYPIIDLANLKYEGYKPEKNLFEDSFKEKPRQISNDGLFYKKGPEKDYVDIESND